MTKTTGLTLKEAIESGKRFEFDETTLDTTWTDVFFRDGDDFKRFLFEFNQDGILKIMTSTFKLKPSPREIWVNEYRDTVTSEPFFGSVHVSDAGYWLEDEILRKVSPRYGSKLAFVRTIKFREVIEGEE